MIRKFLDWKWNITSIALVEVLVCISACIGCAIYAPGIIRVFGVIATLILLLSVCAVTAGMFGDGHQPRTAEEEMAVTFAEYAKRDQEEDRA